MLSFFLGCAKRLCRQPYPVLVVSSIGHQQGNGTGVRPKARYGWVSPRDCLFMPGEPTARVLGVIGDQAGHLFSSRWQPATILADLGGSPASMRCREWNRSANRVVPEVSCSRTSGLCPERMTPKELPCRERGSSQSR